ncbi:Ger(x)C family spore germination protein [Metabacillus iocasae]|uniref:Ger(X)C family germination protein n=1 Tax=Priestia iocasae TaxID=2291674 RepID=A0ABS2QV43_9BACI|nr:Ger(x)C family spore germination protein [Metabacillus iocasae]MBM7702349.1 Ger(x)C family germination protein [Metabacillus iocasae]
MNLSNFRLISLIFLIVAATLLGYFETNRFDSIVLVSALGVEKKEEKYVVSIQVFNPAANQKQGTDEIGGYTYVQSGRTIPEAIEKIDKKLSKKLYLNTLQVVALGENVVKEEGLNPLCDFLIRNTSIPANTQLVVTKKYAPDVFLQLFTPDQKLSSLYVTSMLKQYKSHWGALVLTSPERVKSLLEEHTLDIVIPYIEIRGEIEEGLTKRNIEQFKPSSLLSLSGLGAFHKDKLHRFLSASESDILSLIKDVNQKVSMTVPCEDSNGFVTIDTIQTSSSISSKVKPLSFAIDIHIEANINSMTCQKELSDPKTIKELEKTIEAKITEDVNNYVSKELESPSDVMGLKDVLYREHPHYWKKNKGTLENSHADWDVKANVNVQIVKIGYTNKISS